MLSVIKKFNKLFNKSQKRSIVVILFMMLVGACLEVVGVSLMIPLMTAIMQPDIVESNGIIKRVCELLQLRSHQAFVLTCIVVLIVIFIVKNLYLMLEYYVQNRFIYHSQFATQKRMLKSFLERPYEYFLNARISEMLRIIQTDVANTYSLLMTLMSFATETIVSTALLITIFVMDPAMTAFVALMMLINITVITKVIKPVLRKEGIAIQIHATSTSKWLLQALNGIKEVKVTHKEKFFEEQYGENGFKMTKTREKSSVLNHFPRLLIEMTSVCSMLALIAVLIYRGQDIGSLIPTIAAFAMAALKLMPSANRIISAINNVAFKEPSLDQLLIHLKLMEQEERVVQHSIEPDEKRTTRNKLMLQKEILLKDITYRYSESETNVLSDASMTIPIGKSVGIVGVSGAGKTTTADIMLGLLTPQAGQVLADGQDVMESYEEWLSCIGYIPQSIFFMDDTIRANVAFGTVVDEQSDERIWHVLEEAQLADFVASLPKGLDTKIGERGVRLSGGQQQRIGIARALYTDPEILVFDEATSSLDNETEAAIMESINSLHGKKTMVIIAHRLQTIAGCDIVYRVAEESIVRER